tara:strand:- start:10988 stop:11134 length:147 start_codon:yes stop_codon:yes gene_type:complete
VLVNKVKLILMGIEADTVIIITEIMVKGTIERLSPSTYKKIGNQSIRD